MHTFLIFTFFTRFLTQMLTISLWLSTVNLGLIERIYLGGDTCYVNDVGRQPSLPTHRLFATQDARGEAMAPLITSPRNYVYLYFLGCIYSLPRI